MAGPPAVSATASSETAYDRRRAGHVDERGEGDHELLRCVPEFTGGSGSLGHSPRDLTDTSAFVANLSRHQRAPALEKPTTSDRTSGISPSNRQIKFQISKSDRHRCPASVPASPHVSSRVNFSTSASPTSSSSSSRRNRPMGAGGQLSSRPTAVPRFEGSAASSSAAAPPARLAELRSSQAHRFGRRSCPRIPPLFCGRVELEIPWREFTFSPEVVFAAEPEQRVQRRNTHGPDMASQHRGDMYLLPRHATTVLR